MSKEHPSAPHSELPGEGSSAPETKGETLPTGLADEELKRLMRRAFDDERRTPVDVLGGVQKRIWERSGGKFYKDGWSTSRHPPFTTYFITALLMLATVVLIYAIIAPVIPDPVPQTSTPVQVVPGPEGTR